MAVQTQRKLFTVTDFYKMAEVGILDWEDRVELIHGEILEMSPINSPHAKIVARLTRILNAILGERALVRGQCPIHIDEYSEPEPDVSVVEFQIEEYEDQHPRPEEVYLLRHLIVHYSGIEKLNCPCMLKPLFLKSGF